MGRFFIIVRGGEVGEIDDADEFFEILSQLIQEEQEHIDELGKYSQKLDRIR